MKWFNREHLKHMNTDDFVSYIHSAIAPIILELPQYSDERFMRLLPTIRERVATSGDAVNDAEKGEYDFAFQAPHIDLAMLKWKNDPSVRDTLPRLRTLAEIVSLIPEGASIEAIKEAIWGYAEEVGRGDVLWPLRVALTGRERSPDPFTVIHIIGSGESYQRIKSACDTILNTPA
jgi:glutamyl/glutaminyl-tRNA synthetase